MQDTLPSMQTLPPARSFRTDDFRVGYNRNFLTFETVPENMDLLPGGCVAEFEVLSTGQRRVRVRHDPASKTRWGRTEWTVKNTGKRLRKIMFDTAKVQGLRGAFFAYSTPLVVSVPRPGEVVLTLAASLPVPRTQSTPDELARRLATLDGLPVAVLPDDAPAAPVPDPVPQPEVRPIRQETLAEWRSGTDVTVIEGGHIPPGARLQMRGPPPTPEQMVRALNAHARATGDRLALNPEGELRLWVSLGARD